jgi:putative tricarboxylic transport membrane protein
MNTIFIVFWFALSFFLIIVSYQEGLGHLHKPGPGLWPFLIGVGFLLLNLLQVYHEVAARRVAKRAEDQPSEGQEKINVRKINMVFISLIVYGLLFTILGFIVDTFLLLLLLFWGMGIKPITAVISSLITVLGSHFLFTYLGVRFPLGILRLIGL